MQYKIVDVNDIFLATHNLNRKNLIGKVFLPYVHPSQQAAARNAFDNVVNTQRPAEFIFHGVNLKEKRDRLVVHVLIPLISRGRVLEVENFGWEIE